MLLICGPVKNKISRLSDDMINNIYKAMMIFNRRFGLLARYFGAMKEDPNLVKVKDLTENK